MARANPFSDLNDFEPKSAPKAKPVERAQIDRLAQDNGFPSRQPSATALAAAPLGPAVKTRRRYTTGRNQQINVKAKAETIERLYRLADEHAVPLGELLELALAALEQAAAKK